MAKVWKNLENLSKNPNLEYKAKTTNTTLSIRSKIKVSMNEFWPLLTLWYSLFLPCTPEIWKSGHPAPTYTLCRISKKRILQRERLILLHKNYDCDRYCWWNLIFQRWKRIYMKFANFLWYTYKSVASISCAKVASKVKIVVTSWCSGRLIGSPRQRSRVQDPFSTINIHEGGH